MGAWYIDKIIIDSNEKNRGHNAYNHYIEKYDATIESLNYGDYLFKLTDDKEVVFEYKTCQDFINSMSNKSLFQELSNQTMNYEYSYLIVSGDFDETFTHLYYNVPQYRYKYKTPKILAYRLTKQINGALARIYSIYIPIIFVETEEDAFNTMLNITSKISDNKKYGGVVRPSPKKLDENPVQGYLTRIKGIGNKKSENITNELGIECLDDLCRLKPSDFLSIHRVNEKNVCELWKKIHNEDLEL